MERSWLDCAEPQRAFEERTNEVAQDIGGLTHVQHLLPTMLELCGLDTSASFRGTSLAPVLQGKANVPEDRTLIINYSRMPNFVNYPTPFARSIMTRNHAAVLWKRWRLLEDRGLYNLEIGSASADECD